VSEPKLERVRVSAVTVIAWISAILSVTAWLGWAALSNRIVVLESGATTPMGETTRIRFEQVDRARERIEVQFDRIEARLDNIEQRVRANEVARGRQTGK
jgi:hypothetical protein